MRRTSDGRAVPHWGMSSKPPRGGAPAGAGCRPPLRGGPAGAGAAPGYCLGPAGARLCEPGAQEQGRVASTWRVPADQLAAHATLPRRAAFSPRRHITASKVSEHLRMAPRCHVAASSALASSSRRPLVRWCHQLVCCTSLAQRACMQRAGVGFKPQPSRLLSTRRATRSHHVSAHAHPGVRSAPVLANQSSAPKRSSAAQLADTESFARDIKCRGAAGPTDSSPHLDIVAQVSTPLRPSAVILRLLLGDSIWPSPARPTGPTGLLAWPPLPHHCHGLLLATRTGRPAAHSYYCSRCPWPCVLLTQLRTVHHKQGPQPPACSLPASPPWPALFVHRKPGCTGQLGFGTVSHVRAGLTPSWCTTTGSRLAPCQVTWLGSTCT